MRTYKLGEVCQHGSLARQCELCRMEDEIEQLRSALRIIHTWASVPGALDANYVRDLTERVLFIRGDKK